MTAGSIDIITVFAQRDATVKTVDSVMDRLSRKQAGTDGGRKHKLSKGYSHIKQFVP